uniref:Uncharacterized protein n=1 Tax=Lygus hesperus TaxID=30085 RepID=A0A0A9XER5_LYGHE
MKSFCDEDTELCYLDLPRKDLSLQPPKALLILFPTVSVMITIALVNINILRHLDSPVCDRKGNPISITRIAIEDSLFCMYILLTAMLFICSNLTTAASLTVGNNILMYNFSLMNSVHDFWFGGLKPLSVIVMIFSCLYPYFKLFVMLMYTVVFHKPESTVLKVIESLGKYGYIDTLVMVIMVGGMCVSNIATVLIRPSFYYFVIATTMSISAGNYGVHFWRYGTSIRHYPCTV